MPQLHQLAEALHARQRIFAEHVARGMVGSAAYVKAGYSERGAETGASKLLRNPKVAAYLGALQQQASDDCRWSKRDAMDYLLKIAETPVGEIAPDHPLCQEHREGTEHTGSVVKMPDKLAAIRQLSAMCGWNQPERVQHSIGGLEQLRDLMREAMEPELIEAEARVVEDD